MRQHAALALLAALLSPAPLLAQEPARHDHAPGAHAGEKLGTVTFPGTAARAAQAPFLRGLALLHSFEYDDAADAFRIARTLDPKFAMAYWGEALTHAKLLWGLDGVDSGRVVLATLGPTAETRLAKAGSARERRYGAAVEALFADADLKTRLRRYVAGLRALTAAYPDDLEARALLSIALQMGGAGYDGNEQRTRRDEAITLAQSIFARQPDHPGGAHYLIHATDDPEFAPRGLAAARAYAQIAPDADHALHMPSHIFVQLGLWDDVVGSNERSWASSRAWVKARGASADHHSFHALGWLLYGYLQQGRHAAASALLDTVHVVLKGVDWSKVPELDARYTLGEFQFSYARESGDWSVYAGTPSPHAVPPTATSSSRARSLAFFDSYRAAFASARAGDTATALALAATFTGTTPTSDIARAHVAALVAKARGDRAGHLAKLREAAAADEKVAHFGPPFVYPPHELLGDALLEAGQPRDAIAAYRKGLALMPNRSASLLGLLRAQRAAGDMAEAAKTEATLRANWRSADPGVLARVAVGG